MVGMIDCIRNGVTTIFDHHASPGAVPGSLFRIADAALQTGVRGCLCYEVSDRDGAEIAAQGIEENRAFLQHCRQSQARSASRPLRPARLLHIERQNACSLRAKPLRISTPAFTCTPRRRVGRGSDACASTECASSSAGATTAFSAAELCRALRSRRRSRNRSVARERNQRSAQPANPTWAMPWAARRFWR